MGTPRKCNTIFPMWIYRSRWKNWIQVNVIKCHIVFWYSYYQIIFDISMREYFVYLVSHKWCLHWFHFRNNLFYKQINGSVFLLPWFDIISSVKVKSFLVYNMLYNSDIVFSRYAIVFFVHTVVRLFFRKVARIRHELNYSPLIHQIPHVE